ncbi:HPr kinase/phosphorylase [Rhizobium sp. WL3]|uniref:HPr kinase/phosphorylase n=1 Tax=Rhizobium sp. WL3 TaxID=2603277 RepID=UPI0011C201DE|nr:HPr kinase/phosphorylase [Rhizobium sp. WL3]QEE45829.1 HPr kinase/phosphorylase [Rhizobium sp. WL3]
MNTTPANIHGTAISVDGIGLLFLGPSGSGKSSLAFDCLAEGRLGHLSGALIADDRVFILRDRSRVIARCPDAIRGLIELRYSGIVSVDHVTEAEIHFAVLPVPSNEVERLPPNDEQAEIAPGVRLPAIRLPLWSRFPLSLIFARIQSLKENG